MSKTTTAQWQTHEYPVASHSTDGLMSASDRFTLDNLVSDVQSIKEGGVWRGTFPTYADLEASFHNLDVSATNWSVNDFIYLESDETHDGKQTDYIITSPSQGVLKLEYLRELSLPIQQATNANLGVVLGEESDGKISVESNGTMKLTGYDQLVNKENIDELLNLVKGKIPKVFSASGNSKSGLELDLMYGLSIKIQDLTVTLNNKSASGINYDSRRFNIYDTNLIGTDTRDGQRLNAGESYTLQLLGVIQTNSASGIIMYLRDYTNNVFYECKYFISGAGERANIWAQVIAPNL